MLPDVPRNLALCSWIVEGNVLICDGDAIKEGSMAGQHQDKQNEPCLLTEETDTYLALHSG